ncbi:uncharacterized protein LOC136042188 [Artemia franciscana]|uniref:Uncharacterized protein n=1 Tax=Artemia franciscana TaxID=6661 RepID=A0AA88HCV8_ARTSF|nr:hypothetical protein QYM36_018408 [Artemia franciscana]
MASTKRSLLCDIDLNTQESKNKRRQVAFSNDDSCVDPPKFSEQIRSGSDLQNKFEEKLNKISKKRLEDFETLDRMRSSLHQQIDALVDEIELDLKREHDKNDLLLAEGCERMSELIKGIKELEALNQRRRQKIQDLLSAFSV